MSAVRAAPVFLTAKKALEYRRKILFDIFKLKIFFINTGTALWTKPQQTIFFTGQTPALNHQTDAVSETLRRMRHFGRQQENLTLANRNVLRLAFVDDFEQHIAFDLVEKFRAFIVVIVTALIRTTDHHDDEIFIRPDHLVAHRGLEQVAMLLDPLHEIDGHTGQHGSSRIIRS